jgi:hypothetical protein
MTDSLIKFGTSIFALFLLGCASSLRAQIHPVVEVKTGILLGASSGPKWLDGKHAAKQVKPGLLFRIFDLGQEMGAAKAQKVEAEMDICPDVQIVSFAEKPASGEIALAAPWKALPRPIRVTDTTQQTYRDTARDFLISRGLPKPKVKITQILRADLDGDGEDEVLLSATKYEAEEDSAPTSAQAGDYSFVLLRQSRGGKVETKLVEGEFYKKYDNSNTPYVHRISAILDLDGDGKLEFVLSSNYYEGGTTTVYRYTPSSLKKLVSVSCGA